MDYVKQILKRLSVERGGRIPAVVPAPLLLALEPRVVYDASVGAVAAHPHPHGVEADHAHPATTSSAPSKPVAEHDVKLVGANGAREQKLAVANAAPAVSHQVVFIDPSVVDYQALIAGLPAGTQYVVLNANTDGFAQIEQYLQTHKGVDAIHLISHGTDGEIQAGDVWLDAGDLSKYSAELTQIGALMKPGGDFLIYGCDVAQDADGQMLVQEIAALTHLNVAASTDATGSAAVGGNWTLEYQVGTVTTPVILSAAAEQNYDHLLGVTIEDFTNADDVDFDSGEVPSFTLDGLTYTYNTGSTPYDTQVESDSNLQALADENGGDQSLALDAGGQGNVNSITISMANGKAFNIQSLDIDIVANGNVEIVPDSNTAGEVTLVSGGVFVTQTVSLSSSNAAFDEVHSITISGVGGDLILNLAHLVYSIDGPTITTDAGSAAFVAGDNTTSTPVTVDSGLSVADTSATTSGTGTVSITSGFHSGEDSLGFTNSGAGMGNITGSYSTSTGVLTLTSAGNTATTAQWQAAFDSVTYTDTAISPIPATRTISFSLTDSNGDPSNVATRTVTVTDVDQTPLLSTSGGSVGYVAGAAGTSVYSGVSVSDRDNGTLPSATVSITSGFQTGDTLSFANNGSTMGNITGSYNTTTGVMTLSSASDTATAAQWDAAIDAVHFSAPDTASGSRSVSVQISDGSENSVAVTETVNLTAVPLVTTDTGSAAFVAGDNTASTPVVVDSGLTVSDAGHATLDSATVSISSNFHSGEDVLGFTNNGTTMGDISSSYDAGTGVMTLTAAGGATLAQWRSALESVTYTDTAVTPNNATRTISFTVNDGTESSPVATRTVTVSDTDQTPILTTSGGTTAFTAGNDTAATPVVVDSNVTVSDLDNTTLASGTVSITGNFHSGEDVLAFNNTSSTLFGNITASYVSSTGVLSLTSAGATATVAQWQAALEAVTYTDTAVTPNSATRTISFSVNDGTQPSNVGTKSVSVTDVIQTPIVTTTVGSTPFVAGDNAASTPVVVDGGITVADGDSSTLDSATVAITGSFVSNQDLLSFDNTNPTLFGNINASYVPSSGVMTLTSAGGTATLAQWQAALRAVTYTDTAVTPDNTTRTISFTIDDGQATSVASTKTVTVTDTDQTPILTTSGGSTPFTAGDNVTSTPVTVDSGVTVSDLDNTTLASGTVAITGNFHSGEDVLAFNNSSSTLFGNITGSYDAGNGVLSLTSAGATATTAQWQAALESVTYTDTAVTPNNATRTISFAVNDGTDTSDTGTKTVTVSDVDQTPIVTTSIGSTPFAEGDNTTATPVAIDTGITVSDRDNTTLSFATVTITNGFAGSEYLLAFTNTSAALYGNINASYNAGTGVLTLESSGAEATTAQWQAALRAVTYTDLAATPNTTARTISFAVNDGTETSAASTKLVTVTDVDQAPVVTASGGSTAFTAGDNVTSTPVAVDPGVIVSDADNTTLASGTVAITGNFHSGEDVLAFSNTSTTSFGNITGSYDTTTGVLTLTSAGAAATVAQWQAALESVTYTDTAVTPNSAARTISFTVNDGTENSVTSSKTVTVADVDQTPVLTSAMTSNTSYLDGNAPKVVDSGITVTDGDNTTLASATISITSGLQSGDMLTLNINPATMGSVSATYDATTGVMTISSSGAPLTVAQWDAVLEGVSFSTNSFAAPLGSRTISFIVNDGVENSAAFARTVDVGASAPTLTSGTGSPSFTAGDNVASTPVTIDSGITVADPESLTVETGTVSIAGGFHSGEDVLEFTNNSATMGDITGSYNASTGVLTLTSNSHATLAQWQAALSSVEYDNTAITPNTASRMIDFVINDGKQSSAVSSKTITVQDTDQTPPPPPTGGGTGTSTTTGTTTSSDVPHPATPLTLPPSSSANATPNVGQGVTPITELVAPAPDTLPVFPDDLGDSISNPLIVLDAFAPEPTLGSIPDVFTATFENTSARTPTFTNEAGRATNSLSDTGVSPMESIPTPDLTRLSIDLPDLTMRVTVPPDGDFSVSLPAMLSNAEGSPVDADTHVDIRLADGRPLPGWLHYDPVRGMLIGKVPPHQGALHFAIVTHDAAGHQTRREVAIDFSGARGQRASGTPAHERSHTTKPAPQAAIPLAKPSLTEQFARAHATLHVVRATAAPTAGAAAAVAAPRGNA